MPDGIDRLGGSLLRTGSLVVAILAASPLAAAPQDQSEENKAGGDVTFDINAPLTEVEDFGVAWPEYDSELALADNVEAEDLLASIDVPLTADELALLGLDGDGVTTAAVDDTPEQSVEFLSDASTNYAYDVELTGLPEDADAAIEDRFRQLSALETNDNGDANIAQVRRRAQEDVELTQQLLEVEGYYDGQVETLIEPAGKERLAVTLTAEPGKQYTVDEVDLTGLDGAEPEDRPALVDTFGVKSGDPLNQDKVVEGRDRMAVQAGTSGYPFASFETPIVVVDHAALMGDVTVPFVMGGRYSFGDIVVESGEVVSPRHIQRIARFDRGELYDVRDVEDLRQALIATGLVSSVDIAPRRSQDDGEVELVVNMRPAPVRTIAGEVGYNTGEGFRAEASWEHRNLFPPEGALKIRGVAGTQEQLLGATFRRNNFLGRDRVLTLQALASNVNRDAYDARTALISANFERKTTLIFQKEWTYFFGGELRLTDERSALGNAGQNRQTYYIAALPAGIFYDATKDLLNPQSGFRLGVRASPEMNFNGQTQIYGRVQLDGSLYYPATEKLVIAGRARLGSIFGAEVADIAPSRRNYAGGGGSVRGYGYQRIGPLYTNGNPIGGRGLAELSLEARYRFGDFGIVPFIDAGTVSTEIYPNLDSISVGVGIGARYYTNFGPIRIDLATPLNRREGDDLVAVYVSLGQSF